MDPFRAQIQANYLKDKLEQIDNAPTVDAALVEALKEVLRNQVPTAWHENQTLEDVYRTAMQCVNQINLFHPEQMGRKEDKGSLLAALLDFASQAEVITTMMLKNPMENDEGEEQGKESGATTLEQLCLEVAQIAKATAGYLEDPMDMKGLRKSDDDDDDDTNNNNNNSMTHGDSMVSMIDPLQDPAGHVRQYEETMRALCFEISPNFKWEIHTYRGVGGGGGGGGDSTTNTTNRKGLSSDATRLLYRELAAYKSQLPADYASSIIVRACEAYMDLIRVCIVGPEGTPYSNGLFFFDIELYDYPHSPPKVTLLTGQGKCRLNPNLYQDGKVCLSLLGTWSGPGWYVLHETFTILHTATESTCVLP
jgi:ubiquitin-protein ligase